MHLPLIALLSVGAASADSVILVPPVTIDATAAGRLPDTLDEVVADAAERVSQSRVLSASDLKAALDAEALRMLLGCEAAECFGRSIGKVKATHVLSVRVSRLGEIWGVASKLIEITSARALGRRVLHIKGDTQALLGGLEEAARAVLTGEVHATASDCESPAECLELGNAAYGRREFAASVSYFRSACDGGVADGCHNLGRRYETGEGVARDTPLAVSLYEEACRGGTAFGCHNAGNMYRDGAGVPKAPRLAHNLLMRGCELGYADACSNAGRMFELGNGVEADTDAAARFYRRACEGGSAHGCTHIERLRPGWRKRGCSASGLPVAALFSVVVLLAFSKL